MCYNSFRLFGGECMKKLFMLCSLFLLALPFTVKAEENQKVSVYLFKGDGCPHCADAETYFNSLSDEDKNKFDLVEYEVWYDKTNQELMKQVADKLEETVTGVPYMIVGEKSFSGFTDEIGEDIMNAVNEMYESEEKVDIVEELATELGAKKWTGSSNNTDQSTGTNGNTTTTEKDENSKTSTNSKDNTIVIVSVLGVLLVAGGLLVLARKKM